MNALRASIVAEAESWRGTPYHHQGRVKGAGVDCALLLAEVYHAVMPDLVPHIEPGYYPPDWHMHRSAELYQRWVEKFATRIDGPPMPGDVVLYQWGRCYAHGAIVLDWPNRVMHAIFGTGVTYAEGNNGVLARRAHLFYAPRGA